ncbi:tumor necrosis factor ligand superfamily member 14 [Sphaeramia orbicularis]|uniref:tumor necrosis factor ligand superfamily member 14 n=1 Tax=Sphaeramia orbicularis TaxID=375764 RepID=UPI00117FCB74|nr:tumor necrosis factor ligand superfamily member 14-like [Sphaeramia orbicularis]
MKRMLGKSEKEEARVSVATLSETLKSRLAASARVDNVGDLMRINKSRRLIGWELRTTMHEHSCNFCDQEAGLQGQEPSTPILRQIAHRIHRMSQIHAFGLFFGMSVMALLLIAVLLGGRIQFPDNQVMPPGKALLVSETQQQPVHPSAFLTAPADGTSNGRYLKWETTLGNAHCQGFNYSGGNLTVLRKGYYSIALQITMENINGTCDGNQLHLTVFRFKVQYPDFKSLLETYDTMCCTKGCIKSLFTSGVFSLEAGTILRVEVSHPKHITQRLNEQEVFFSVHLQS